MLKNPMHAKLLAGLVICGALGAAGYYWTQHMPAKAGATGNAEVVAVIGKQQIPKAELMAFIAEGLDPAVARDTLIQRAVLAQAADAQFPEAVAVVSESVLREAKARIFLAQKTEELAKAVSDADVKDWYDKNIKSEDYQEVKLRFYQSASLEDAVAVATAASQGDSKAISKYTPVSKDREGFLMAAEVPYGLGRLVTGQKQGTYLAPVVTRTGAISLVMDDQRKKEKPTLATLQDQIKQILVRTRLAEHIAKLRSDTKVELRG